MTKRRPYSEVLEGLWRARAAPRAKLAVYNLHDYLRERWRLDRLDAEAMFPLRVGWHDAGTIFGGNSRSEVLRGVRSAIELRPDIEVQLQCLEHGDSTSEPWSDWSCSQGCTLTAPRVVLTCSWPKLAKSLCGGARRTPGERPANARQTVPARTVRTRVAKTAATLPPARLTDEQRGELRAWAEGNPKHRWAVPRMLDLEAACLDHFRANGKSKADWVATARNWIRNQPEMAPKTTPPSAFAPSGTSGARPLPPLVTAQRPRDPAEQAALEARERAIRENVARDKAGASKRPGGPLSGDLFAVLGRRGAPSGSS